LTDTIVAIATPPGRGALAVVRVSGPDAIAMGAKLVRPWPDEARHVTHARVYDASNEEVDDVVTVFYREPASFTGEDAVEITCHGGSVAPALVAAAFVSAGARPAEPGEFTRRAVLNGKLDLIQAEAVGDIIDASTRAAQRVALSQLDGGLSRRISGLRDRIIELEALAAYDIDFPEEDDGPISPDRIINSSDEVIAELSALLSTAPVGEIVREGAVVVIAGAPNAGKSSLFNALLGRKRAIVTDVPGTTRDALEAVTEADGWPVRLIDTAGLRDTNETIERMGIEVSREYLEKADLVLACGDSDRGLVMVIEAIRTPAPVLRVRTKSDLLDVIPNDPHVVPNAPHVIPNAPHVIPNAVRDLHFVSAETGAGLNELARAIARTLSENAGALTLDAPILTRERQRVAIEKAREELVLFRDTFSAKQAPAVVAAVHLRDATRVLEELIGSVDVEDVLDRLFSRFCVGK
jgi:tRNA modification GTPase